MKDGSILFAAVGFGAGLLTGAPPVSAQPDDGGQFVTKAGTRAVVPGPEAFFTGTVTIQPLFDAKHPDAPFTGAYVTFEPGARSHWHTHPTGQHLIVTDGVGRTGTADGRIETFRKGDVLWCPPGVRHWHGAAPDTAMTHLALTGVGPDGKNVDWMEPVSDDAYHGRDLVRDDP